MISSPPCVNDGSSFPCQQSILPLLSTMDTPPLSIADPPSPINSESSLPISNVLCLYRQQSDPFPSVKSGLSLLVNSRTSFPLSLFVNGWTLPIVTVDSLFPFTNSCPSPCPPKVNPTSPSLPLNLPSLINNDPSPSTVDPLPSVSNGLSPSPQKLDPSSLVKSVPSFPTNSGPFLHVTSEMESLYLVNNWTLPPCQHWTLLPSSTVDFPAL